ncbi:YrhB domain-containing protein [Saccharothrix obliqua]|uniref:YrhB domain-containing protein n=1 Tax=Saccharothrix obliqua TaxID=2861747 RepID=UPI0027E3A2E4|nr:YrhB domain-containing protein [Saccharothrix obliqua]
MTQPRGTAEQWLDRVYGGAVEPTRFALLETPRVAVFGCRFREGGQPMLAGAVAVPVNGDAPYPLPNDRPFGDLGIGDEDAGDWRAPAERDWAWRVNARNCVVAVDATVGRAPASALAWRPGDEHPRWWDRLRADHFADAEVASCADWGQVVAAIRDGGPDTRGVVWVRRELVGVEVTGHLLYAHHDRGEVAVLDGMTGGPADLETATVGGLVVARFHRARPAPEPDVEDLAAAVRKAERHLADAYRDEVVLVDPSPADELARGWLFACTTRAHLASGDPRDQMLDAALVVPKAAHAAPFALPNADPWPWLERWNAGEHTTPPPAPGPAAWFGPTVDRLGEVEGASTHTAWAGVLDEFAHTPVGAKALVWIRRRDRRGRETVGHVLNARRAEGGLELADGTRREPPPLTDEGVLALHVIRYR